MDMGINYGQIARNMRVTGKMIKQMDLENCFMLMEMYTRVIGQTIKLMERVPTLMRMEPIILEIGMMINSKALE